LSRQQREFCSSEPASAEKQAVLLLLTHARRRNPTHPAALDLESLAADVWACREAGASDAEAVAREATSSRSMSAWAKSKTLKGIRLAGLGLRFFLGTRSASASTSDLTLEGFASLSKALWRWPKSPKRTPLPGCRKACEFGSLPGDLRLYYDGRLFASRSGADRMGAAVPRRRRSRPTPRITNSDGGSFDASTGRKARANSRGSWALPEQFRRGCGGAPGHGHEWHNAARRLVVQRT